MLLAGLGFVLYHAIGRLSDPQEVRAPGMLGLAILGILFNGAAVLRVKSGTSLTEKLVSWHLIEDTLGWVAVLIGAGIMMIWDVPIVDPILSIGISLIVLWNVGRNLKKVFVVLLQTAPENFDADMFESAALEIEGVESLHHIHSWSIDGESHVLSAHLVLSPGTDDVPAIKEEVRGLVDSEEFEHVTLETEFLGDHCPQDETDHDEHSHD
jgi:cobalt-zinc-cadmium efflux system protein